MPITKQKQLENQALRAIKKSLAVSVAQDKAQRTYARIEGNRLNRLYANDYKENQRLRTQVIDIQRQDHRNAVLDKLDKLVWYTYHKNGKEVRIRKKHVDELLKTNVKIIKTQSVTTTLTREMLLNYLYYDPNAGTFEINTGRNEGKLLKNIINSVKKVPRRDMKGAKKLRSQDFVPYHTGFHLVSEAKYIKSEAECLYNVYKKSYFVRAPEGSTLDAVQVIYYIKQNAPTMVISIPETGTSYSARGLAYMCMGAGGDWDYSNGLDNAHKINADHAPQGLRNYSIKTNKPVRIPCRDGNRLNLKWGNIKPLGVGEVGHIAPAQLTRDPTAEKPPKPSRPIRRTPYSYERNIKKVYLSHDPLNPRWTLHNMGNPAYFSWNEADARQEFLRRLNNFKGHKQRLRTGEVLVTR